MIPSRAPRRISIRLRHLHPSVGGHGEGLLVLRCPLRGSLHAKCVVVDRSTALVTSANFTEAAQHRNIEAGLLIRHQGIQRRFPALSERLKALTAPEIMPSSRLPSDRRAERDDFARPHLLTPTKRLQAVAQSLAGGIRRRRENACRMGEWGDISAPSERERDGLEPSGPVRLDRPPPLG